MNGITLERLTAGGFRFRSGETELLLDACSQCGRPVAARVTIMLRLAGVKQSAGPASPLGPMCQDCLDGWLATPGRLDG